MIVKKGQNNQLSSEIKAKFDELKILKHLRQAGIQIAFGFSSGYLFQLIFRLIFTQRNWYRLLESN
ncbi:hypothetical protein SAMN02982927_02625 [Sporolactobacillus nakayamae]|uniref:Uncharacterized protein n=1 Tax=Sporolactobacillus nakayamae TaxID=269670 RepID=A0A1I2UGH0_9BACL|nr:hypothetical protein [Sporolactobacillus nakayamae]SFG73946.1 hypothetical protein SAMN02982927_02625 [Sporolactobacillus nakayamae]